MDNIHAVKETTLTVEKKSLVLVIPYLGSISLQARNKLKNSLKDILNCCKLQIVFSKKTRLGNNFHLKYRIPKDLTSGIIYKFQCGLCNEFYYGECVRHLNVRIGKKLVNMLVYRHLAKNKLSLRTAPWLIIYYFATI